MQAEYMIFKTNVSRTIDVANLIFNFNQDESIKDWGIDIEDVDKVLRVSSQEKSARDIEIMMKDLGYHCEELK